MACTRCSGTRRVGYLAHAPALFSKFIERPMIVTQDRAEEIVTDWASKQHGVLGIMTVMAFNTNLISTKCPDCSGPRMWIEQAGPAIPNE